MDINSQLKTNLLKLNAQQALKLYCEYGDSSALLALIDDGAAELWELPEAKEVFSLLVQKKFSRIGAPKQQITEFRRLQMLCVIYYLKGRGIPVSGDYKNGQQTACEIVGEMFNKSAETVKKEVWQKHNECALFNAYLKAGADSVHLGEVNQPTC
jgi:hypothetical protein